MGPHPTLIICVSASSREDIEVTRSKKRCSGDICNQRTTKDQLGLLVYEAGDLVTKDREKPKGHKGFFSLGCCWKDLLLGCPGACIS